MQIRPRCVLEHSERNEIINLVKPINLNQIVFTMHDWFGTAIGADIASDSVVTIVSDGKMVGMKTWETCISLKGPLVRGGGMGAPLIILSHREFNQLNINARTPSINEYFSHHNITIFPRKRNSSKMRRNGSDPIYLYDFLLVVQKIKKKPLIKMSFS